MKSYLDIVKKVLNEGKIKHNRTGIDTYSVTGAMFEHNMKEGFPLLTSKKMAYKSIFSELEFFIKGYHNKKWLKDNGNPIWNEWCSPILQEYKTDPEIIKEMANIDELGPIYGVQWRNFDGQHEFDINLNIMDGSENDLQKGADQLKYVVDLIKTSPESRRIICSAWNPNQIDAMALPPCHVLWQVLIDTENKEMDLVWYQRSVDTMLGLPFNIASYAALLNLLCLESGIYTPNKLVGMLSDVHIYTNHMNGVKEQLNRQTHKLPSFHVEDFTSIYDFDHKKVKIEDYKSEDKINFNIAI